jgi:hypothetical protein
MFHFYVASWKNLLRETVSSAGRLTLLRICRGAASDSVVGQKHRLSDFILSRLIMESEAFKEGMKAFAICLKPSKISQVVS